MVNIISHGLKNSIYMSSWLELPQNTDFTIENIPFGIFSTEGRKRVGTRVGDHVLDLELLAKSNFFSNQTVETSVFSADVLNPFISLGKEITSSIRTEIQNLLRNENSSLRELQNAIIPVNEVSVHLPVHIGDYTDFYSSLEHATNVGTMFRDPDNALFPNWKHLPVGYHGRSSSILVSGENIHRPNGQTKPDDLNPVFGPSKRVDFELEMGFVIGKNTNIGDSVAITEADDYIFGMVLFNDWSARDVQKWEYVPLGPFLAKSFASSMSPWIVTMEALEPFTVAGPDQDPQVLTYLQFEGDKNYDIKLEVGIQPENSAETVVLTA